MTRKRMQTQTERDLQGIEARRRRDQLAELEAAVSDGAPDDDADDVDTGMTERIEQDPELRLLWIKVDRERKRRANQIAKAMGAKPPAEVLAKITRGYKILKWVVTAIAIPVVTTTVLVIKYVYARGVTDTRAEIERTLLIEDVHELKQLSSAQAKTIRDLEESVRQNRLRIDDFRERRRGGADAVPSNNNPRVTP